MRIQNPTVNYFYKTYHLRCLAGLNMPLIILKMKLNEEKKTQSQKRYYAQHHELVSLLFQFLKHKLLSLYLNAC